MWIKVGSEDSEKLAPKTFRSCGSHDPFGRCCLVHNIIQRIPRLKIRARFHSIGSSLDHLPGDHESLGRMGNGRWSLLST